MLTETIANVPARQPLTDRQRELLDIIVEEIARTHRPPSFRELCVRMGVRSPNGVAYHIKALRNKGWITYEHDLSRTIRVAQDPAGRGIPLLTLEQLRHARI